MKNDSLFFMHITKTAGGSVKELVKGASDKVSVKLHYPSEPGWVKNFSYQGEYQLYFGHFLFGVHNAVRKAPRYACFLRHPMTRVPSHYNHLVNNDMGKVGDHARSFSSLEEYLRHGKRWEMDNLMVRMISGLGKSVAWGEVGYKVYNHAIQNLDNYFEFVGLFEDLQVSLNRLASIIPIDPTAMPEINIGSYKNKVLSAEEKRLIHGLNVFDIELYEYVKGKYSV